MSDKHTLTLDHQVQQARKVKQLTAENAQLRSLLQEVLDAGGKDIDGDYIESIRGELRTRIITAMKRGSKHG